MSAKKKIKKLTDEQYNEYIAVLRQDAALYDPDGKIFVPQEITPPRDEKKEGD